jgi:hypothetical protein
MDALMLDGNAAAGLLHEIFGSEMTTAVGTCDGCGTAGEVGGRSSLSRRRSCLSLPALRQRPDEDRRGWGACLGRFPRPARVAAEQLARGSAHLELRAQPCTSQHAKVPEVRAKRRSERRLDRVAHAVAQAVALDDRRDLRVKGVRELGEEMVLDLVVEPAERPGEKPVSGAEIDSCLDFVNSPDTTLGYHIGR